MSRNVTPETVERTRKLLAGLPLPKVGRPLMRERPAECKELTDLMENNKITQNDIAKLTGMYCSNVSMLLSGAVKLTPYNRSRIMAAINAIISTKQDAEN